MKFSVRVSWNLFVNQIIASFNNISNVIPSKYCGKLRIYLVIRFNARLLYTGPSKKSAIVTSSPVKAILRMNRFNKARNCLCLIEVRLLDSFKTIGELTQSDIL